MEEKEVTFNIVSGITDDNGHETIGITSDIDDNIEYLDINERVQLIMELIAQCGRQIIREKFPDDDIEDYNENDKDQQGVRDNLHQLIESMVYLMVNTIYNLSNAKFGKKAEIIEYSMVTYRPNTDMLGECIHNTDTTYHSLNVNATDPLLASLDFFIDTICCLLNDNVPKSEVRELIDVCMTDMKRDFLELINNYNR